MIPVILRKFFVVGALVFVSCELHAGELPKEDGWSKPVNGLQARVVFGEGKLVAGNLYALVYLELHNAATFVNPLEFDYEAAKNLHLDLRTITGKAPQVGGSNSGIIDRLWQDAFHLTIPMNGTLKFPITTAGGFGTSAHQVVVFDFETGPFLVRFGDPEHYFLSVTLEITKMAASRDGRAWEGKLSAPPVKIPAPPAMPPAEK